MPELLLEIFSEEIPASLQTGAADELQRLMTGALLDHGLVHGAARAFAGPRRLVLAIDGLAGFAPDRREERRGPRFGAPDSAIEGFLRSAGITRENLRVEKMDKGEFYLATIERRGRATPDIIADLVPSIVREFPWPKSMVWGSGTLRWVRPLKSILCCFDGEIVPFEIDGIHSGNVTFGHRVSGGAKITARRFDDYVQKLEAAQVIVDAGARKEIILQEARTLAFGRHLEVIEDPALAEEVAGLVEWPVVLMGGFDPAFLEVPPEVLTTTMRTNQKYFALRNPKSKTLAPHFLVVANLAASDGGSAIVAGNEKVLRARLADAQFFWEQDRKRTLESRLPQLKDIVFHARLGTLHERMERMVRLARDLADGSDDAAAAARLAKADLVTGMVGEFPELQGIMGRYYALHEGCKPEIADAIRDHYSPIGPNDSVPTARVSIAVALADKIDLLAGFFGIGEKPTGSKDPYALRRAALGFIRILLENDLRISMSGTFGKAGNQYGFDVSKDLIKFIADRLKVYLRDRGISHDLISAVFEPGYQDDLVLGVRRIEALKSFLDTEDGMNLLSAHKRAANILRIERKDGGDYSGPADPAKLKMAEEIALAEALARAKRIIGPLIDREDFSGAMAELAKLRAPVDAFFDRVTVNAPEPELRSNRLSLLAEICSTMARVADFNLIEGKS